MGGGWTRRVREKPLLNVLIYCFSLPSTPRTWSRRDRATCHALTMWTSACSSEGWAANSHDSFARNFNILRFREGLGGSRCRWPPTGVWSRKAPVRRATRRLNHESTWYVGNLKSARRRTALSWESASGSAWRGCRATPKGWAHRAVPNSKMSGNGQNSDVIGGVRTRPSVAPGAKAPESDRHRLGRSSVTQVRCAQPARP